MASKGVIVSGKSNYFKVKFEDNIVLTQYRVDFVPEIDATVLKKELIFKAEKALGLGPRFVFDGSSLYTSADINLKTTITHNNREFEITLRQTGVVDENDENGIFQTFNLIFRTAMGKLNLQNIKRNFFDPAAKTEIQNARLELWPGYLTSIRQYDGGILMNAEIIHKFMRMETILDITRRIMQSHPDNWQEELKREVLGTTILTDYTNKTYLIDDIDFQLTPNSTFSTSKGEVKTYAQYYEEKYGIVIKDKNQFLLISRARERDINAGLPANIYLIPEICRATGMTDFMRADFRLMREISEHTRLNPENRIKSLRKFNNRIKNTPESQRVLTEWQVELENDLVDVEIRELPIETIVFGENHCEEANFKSEWQIKGRTAMYKTVDCKRWIYLYPHKIEHDCKNFLKVLIDAAKDMNYTIAQPMFRAIEGDRQETYIEQISLIAEKHPNFILIVLPTNRADRYGAIKRTCAIKYGIPSQLIVENRVLRHKNLRSICTKVAIQINSKLGGIPWLVRIPVKGLMTVGFDVSHDPRDRRKSIGALVATMDIRESSCFYSVTMRYQDGNEMVQMVDQHLKKAVLAYKETIGALPERIVYYRDGVGDSQVQFVKKQEIEPIVETLRDFYGDSPKFAFIVVNKRTNARFFRKMGNQWANPKPGSVIDTTVTCRNREDFYLISQNVGQGTVTPTYYNIIYNESGLDKTKIEMLTYKLCHLYYNWSGTVRIPSVCQNAKKLAFLTTQSLNGESAHENLLKSLYFL